MFIRLKKIENAIIRQSRKYTFFSSLLANNTVERQWVTCRRESNLRLSKDTSTFRLLLIRVFTGQHLLNFTSECSFVWIFFTLKSFWKKKIVTDKCKKHVSGFICCSGEIKLCQIFYDYCLQQKEKIVKDIASYKHSSKVIVQCVCL